MKKIKMKFMRRGGLFALLTKNYLAFTLVLLLIAVAVNWLWNRGYDAKISEPRIEEMISSDAFKSGRYIDVKTKRYLGYGGAFAVLDREGKLVYRSAPDFEISLTPSELSIIPEYSVDRYTTCTEYIGDNGKTQYLIIMYMNLSADDVTKARIMVLNEDYKVIYGGIDVNKQQYTKSEFEYLTGRWSNKYELYRSSITDANGNPGVVLVRRPAYTQEYYKKAMTSVNCIWLLVFPLYIIAAFVFIMWMNRKIRRPLEKLDNAIVHLGNGESARATDCGGPQEIRELARNFDEMAAKLEKSERERKHLEEVKQTLITDISHDLKTPITVISGYTNAIRDGKVSEQDLPHYLEVIDSKATALTALINTFYEYSKTEHPDFKLECQEMDICEFMREYLAEKYEEINLASFNLAISIPEACIWCKVDTFQFRRALDNILSNSLRHNTLGTVIFVGVKLTGDKVSIRIADNGNGIPSEIRDRLFEPFTVGDQSRSGGSSGLGLAIARRIVETHGGTVCLVSPKDGAEGTEFEILLPVMRS